MRTPPQRVGALDEHALGDLEPEGVRRQPVRLERTRHGGVEVHPVELRPGHVHPHGDVVEARDLVAPGAGLAARRVQGTGAEVDDEGGFLGEGDEVGGVDRPSGGVVPPEQRLDAHDGAVGERDDRLVVEGEGVGGDGLLEVALEHEPLDDGQAGRLVEDGDLRPACVLGPVHGGVGVS